MKVKTPDGRVFQGTALQIVQGMKSLDFGPAPTIADYIDDVAQRAAELTGAAIHVVGETDEERAASLVSSLIGAGFLADPDAASESAPPVDENPPTVGEKP